MSPREAIRPAPLFVADHKALDFLNSVASPWGELLEWVGDGHALLDWLEQAGLAPDHTLSYFRQGADAKVLNQVAEQARELREWFRDFVERHAGEALEASALEELDPLNRILMRDNTHRQIEANSGHAGKTNGGRSARKQALQWRQERHWKLPSALLLPIAETIGDLICHADFTLVKHCEGPTCTLWVYDVSKNHTRRWCSMAVCGNRVKAAAHRAKKRAASA